jgi:ABC-type lipoprotein release transport system permease subunit
MERCTGRRPGAAQHAVRGVNCDPFTLVAVALLMGIVAMAASLVPAWRAAQADPPEATRAE